MTQKLSIAHITTVHNKNDNRIFHKYIKTLAARSAVNVHYVYRDDDEDWPTLDESFTKHPLKVQAKKRWIRALVGNFKVGSWATKNKISIYHFHDPELLPVALLLRIFGKRIIFDVHENLVLQLSEKYDKGDLQSKIIRAICIKAIAYSSSKIPQIYAETSYEKYFPHCLVFINMLNYPDISSINVPLRRFRETDQFKFVYVGTLTRERGVILMLNAFKIFNKKQPNSKLLMVGKSSESLRREFATHIKEQNIENVEIGKFMDPGNIPELLSECHVGLSVLSPIMNYLESIPTKNYDYLAHGLVVITSNFRFYQECFGNMALYADPTEVDSVVEKMCEAYEKFEQLSNSGLEEKALFLKGCSWQGQVEELISFYREVHHG